MLTDAEVSELKRRSIPAYFISTAIYWELRLWELTPKPDDKRVASLSFEDGSEVNEDDRQEYCHDLAAARLLANWEELGIRTHVDAGLPTAQQADEMLAQKRRRRDRSSLGQPVLNPDDWFEPCVIDVDTNSLWCRVLLFAVDHFASSAPESVGTDIPIERGNEDAFVDELAAFLWRHRHHLPPGGEIILERPK